MQSICFKCSNARADKCKKIRNGTPIKGWVAEETKGGGYIVKECPRFEKDKTKHGVRITMAEIAKILYVSERTLYRYGAHKITIMMKERGYNLRVIHNNGIKEYYLKDDLV